MLIIMLNKIRKWMDAQIARMEHNRDLREYRTEKDLNERQKRLLEAIMMMEVSDECNGEDRDD